MTGGQGDASTPVMAANRGSASSEKTANTFYYAQAAKGRSPSVPIVKLTNGSGPSGTATPSSTSMTESTPASSWADESEATFGKSETTHTGEHHSSAVDKSLSVHASDKSGNALGIARRSSSYEMESTNALGASIEQTTKAPSSTTSKMSEADKAETIQSEPAKPVMHESRPPAVNIWQQRAALARTTNAKPTPNSAPTTTAPSAARSPERLKPEGRRQSEQGSGNVRNGDMGPPSRTESKFHASITNARIAYPILGTSQDKLQQHSTRARASSLSAPPAVSNSIHWPKPTDVSGKDRQQSTDKDDKAAGSTAETTTSKSHGKLEWKTMPYTPSAVFETPVIGNGRVAQRMGTDGSRAARGGPNGFGRGGSHSVTGRPMTKSSDNTSSHPITSDVSNAAYVASPGSSDGANATGESKKERVSPAHDGNMRANAGPKRQQSLRKPDSGRKWGSVDDSASRNPSMNASSEIDGRDQRRTHGYRGTEPPFEHSRDGAYRDNKRVSTKQPARQRAWSPNESFSLSNASQNSLTAQHAAYMSQRDRPDLAYRGPMRSQSIPMDSVRREAFDGAYQTSSDAQPVPFSADYYGAYPGGAYPSEQDLLYNAVAMQLEYYFSLDNLLKDMFLRKHMDSQGWIFLTFIADFNRLKQLTTDYGLLRAACLDSAEVELRVGEDGKDRVRKVESWQQFVLPMSERHDSVQNDGPLDLRRPSLPLMEAPAFSPRNGQHAASMFGGSKRSQGASRPLSGLDPRLAEFAPADTKRGRQEQSPQQSVNMSTDVNQFPTFTNSQDNEADDFSSNQIESLTVVVRKQRAGDVQSNTTPATRTFSDGSIDLHEIAKSEQSSKVGDAYGLMSSCSLSANLHSTSTSEATSHDQATSTLTLFWVKDKASPIEVESVPADTTHEQYTTLRSRALQQRREAAATGTCPYDLDVLYQFWSHFLIRNFNSAMYQEFRQIAWEDNLSRHSDVGLQRLVKYYNEALCSQAAIREPVLNDFVNIFSMDKKDCHVIAVSELRKRWHNGMLNLKNRKRLHSLLPEHIRKELDE